LKLEKKIINDNIFVCRRSVPVEKEEEENGDKISKSDNNE